VDENKVENTNEVADSNEEIQYMDEATFKEHLKQTFGEVYTLKGLKKKYVIESVAYGGVLCTNKKTGSMCIFMDVKSETTQYFYKSGGL